MTEVIATLNKTGGQKQEQIQLLKLKKARVGMLPDISSRLKIYLMLTINLGNVTTISNLKQYII